jgi:hypothetical protein
MRLSGRQEGAAGGAPQGRRGMKGADAQQKVELTSDCCCSRVARLRVLAALTCGINETFSREFAGLGGPELLSLPCNTASNTARAHFD